MQEKQPIAAKSYKGKKRFPTVLFGFMVLFAAIFGVTSLVSYIDDKNASENVPVKTREAAKSATIRITDKGFVPSTLLVKQNTRIIWTNTDGSLHQIASNSQTEAKSLGNLKSEILNTAQTYSYTASTAGSFAYHDPMQPTLNGTIVVEKK